MIYFFFHRKLYFKFILQWRSDQRICRRKCITQLISNNKCYFLDFVMFAACVLKNEYFVMISFLILISIFVLNF